MSVKDCSVAKNLLEVKSQQQQGLKQHFTFGGAAKKKKKKMPHKGSIPFLIFTTTAPTPHWGHATQPFWEIVHLIIGIAHPG